MGGMLKNYRHELFLREYIVNGFRGADAYRKVYAVRKTAAIQAAKIMSIPKVRTRLDQMMKRVLKRAEITEERILGKYEQAFDLAEQQAKPADMISAATAQAKLVGMLRDRIEAGSPGDFANMENISDVLEAIGQQAGPEIAAKIGEALGILRPIEAQPAEELTQLAETPTATDSIN